MDPSTAMTMNAAPSDEDSVMLVTYLPCIIHFNLHQRTQRP